jgi:hypothetical protein
MFARAVIERCDGIHVPAGFEKELKFIPLHLLREPLRKLSGEKRKFHVESSLEDIMLPERVDEELRRCKANSFNIKVVRLALRRSRRVKRLYLVSNDSCTQRVRNLLEPHKIYIRSLDEFKDEYLPSLTSRK